MNNSIGVWQWGAVTVVWCACPARLKLRKQLRKRTVVNEDGREETILTEEIGVEQDTEAPEELQGCVQNIIDDFLASDKIVH